MENKIQEIRTLALEEIEKALNVKVLVCDHTGEDLVDIINKACQEEK